MSGGVGDILPSCLVIVFKVLEIKFVFYSCKKLG